MKPSGVLSSFILLVKKGIRLGVSNILRILFIVIAFTMQNILVFRDGCLKVVWNVRLVCIESIGNVNLLFVNVHFNIWENWMHYFDYIGNSSNFFFLFFTFSWFSEYNRLIIVLLFLFLTLVCLVTTSFDKFELQCQKRHINVIVPIRLQFKLYAVFIKWSSWINFLFMRRQDIVNNWDFPSKISRHCHKRLVPKSVVWHDRREMFAKRSLRDELDCVVDFDGMIVLCLLPPVRLRLPSPNCFFRVCFPTLFAADLKDFLPSITSPISGAANSNMSAPMRFPLGQNIDAKRELQFSQ